MNKSSKNYCNCVHVQVNLGPVFLVKKIFKINKVHINVNLPFDKGYSHWLTELPFLGVWFSLTNWRERERGRERERDISKTTHPILYLKKYMDTYLTRKVLKSGEIFGKLYPVGHDLTWTSRLIEFWHLNWFHKKEYNQPDLKLYTNPISECKSFASWWPSGCNFWG